MAYFNRGIRRNKTEGAVGAPRRAAAIFLLAVFASVLAFTHPTDARAEEEEGRTSGNPHDFANVDMCFVCHAIDIPKLNFDTVTTCTRCHSGNIGNHPLTRHPIGVAPSINIPSNLPLSSDGRFVCYTCHDTHNATSNKDMLRVSYAKLCASCHVGY